METIPCLTCNWGLHNFIADYCLKYDLKPSDVYYESKLCNCYDPISDPITDPITDVLSDFDLLVMRTIKNHQGLNVPKLLEIIVEEDSNATIDKIKNSLKRHLEKYCEFRGSRSSGGYYIK
jgi:hypothetical protein